MLVLGATLAKETASLARTFVVLHRPAPQVAGIATPPRLFFAERTWLTTTEPSRPAL